MMNPTLKEDFDYLRLNASSLLDLQEWLNQHPDVAAGNLGVPAGATFEVNLSYNPNLILSTILEANSVRISVMLSMTTVFKAHTFFDNESTLRNLKPKVETDYEYPLSLSLDDWPLACVHAVVEYLSYQGTAEIEDPTSGIADIESIINAALGKHFVDINLRQLQTLLATDLIPMDENGLPDMPTISTLLAGTRNSNKALSLPHQLLHD